MYNYCSCNSLEYGCHTLANRNLYLEGFYNCHKLNAVSHCPIIWCFVGSDGKSAGKLGSTLELTIERAYAILKNRMESEGLWHVRLDLMDCIRLFISIVARNALWYKYNKNRMRSVGKWERKNGWNLSKHESHQISSVNTNAIKLFKIGQWDAGFTRVRGWNFLLKIHNNFSFRFYT